MCYALYQSCQPVILFFPYYCHVPMFESASSSPHNMITTTHAATNMPVPLMYLSFVYSCRRFSLLLFGLPFPSPSYISYIVVTYPPFIVLPLILFYQLDGIMPSISFSIRYFACTNLPHHLCISAHISISSFPS